MNQKLLNIDKKYPTYYDLRDKINIKVENQGDFWLCWDFAMTKALETTYEIKIQVNLDLSEMYIDYWQIIKLDVDIDSYIEVDNYIIIIMKH